MPADDAEAASRIVEAARALVQEDPGSAPTISQVAERLSITRQTVYRYYPSAVALLEAAVSDRIGEFLDTIALHLRDERTASEAVIEGIAYTYDEIQRIPALHLLLGTGERALRSVTSDVALALGRSILDRLPVDWAADGYDDQELDDLVELMLRTLQSFIIDPGDPPRSPDELRAYLRRWVGPAVAARPAAAISS